VPDTTFLKDVVEPYVREWLGKNFGSPFQPEFLPLTRVCGKPAVHEFDAVSSDGRIVCGIKTASWMTSGGNRGDGKIKGAYAEIACDPNLHGLKSTSRSPPPSPFQHFPRYQ
jgi:hypothetical protein